MSYLYHYPKVAKRLSNVLYLFMHILQEMWGGKFRLPPNLQ